MTRLIVRSLDTFSQRVIQRLTLEAHANVTEATPVDTGWARANWVPAIGEPFEETAGSAEQAADGRVSQAEAQLGLAEVATAYRIERGPVFISNNVPYIASLNDGSSDQAPTGFVQTAIADAVRTVAGGPPPQPPASAEITVGATRSGGRLRDARGRFTR